MPPEALRARYVLALCDRFHCLPSQLAAEPSDLMRMLDIERLTYPQGG